MLVFGVLGILCAGLALAAKGECRKQLKAAGKANAVLLGVVEARNATIETLEAKLEAVTVGRDTHRFAGANLGRAAE